MSERLFVFVQAELPFVLAFPDGRYVVRARAGGDPQHVLVVKTLRGGGRRDARGSWHPFRARSRGRAWRGRAVDAEPGPAAAPIVRATVIDPVSLSAERQAQAWLEAIDAEKEIRAAFAVINRALGAQRIAGADPAVHAITPSQALTMRAGWGAGEQVADGRWRQARELRWSDERPRGRVAALRPQERFTALLGARAQALVCEELALRAREDLDLGRTRHAALELDRAYTAALVELHPDAPVGGARRGAATMAQRLNELEGLREGVADAARVALGSPQDGEVEVPGDVVGHALSRLEAALRARAAAS
jgi:hypothetical protein